MQDFIVQSPDRSVSLSFFLEDGRVSYSVTRDGVTMAGRAPIGIVTEACDFSSGFQIAGEERGQIDEEYVIPAFKKARCRNHANTLSLRLEKAGHFLTLEGRAFDEGAALRLILEGSGEVKVTGEATAFALPEEAGEIYGMKWIPSYEDHYHPIPREDLHQNAYVFPMLAHIRGAQWALYAEAAVFGDYCGSNLCSTPEAPGMLRVMQAPDQLDPICSPLPLATPWRVVVAGDLNAIVNTNLLENLCPPSIVKNPSFIRPGRTAWSWMTEPASPKDPARQRDYVDYAEKMGFEYVLDDGGWPGNVDIPELVRYADSRGVRVWIWEHCQDMRDPAEAEAKMKLWKSWGVVGLKIDFFESDSQTRLKQYEMLAQLAADHELMLNFHGCMKPAGWSRTWPHVMSYEGVQGGEYLNNFSTWTPGGPNAAHHCTLPFTRNVMGPMDFTPTVYRSLLTGTTDTHQTALPFLFNSYVTHIGEGAEKVLENPCRPALEKLRTVWDETLLLEGYPANYVTMARRSGEDWFVAGICARRPRNSKIHLDFLGNGEYRAELFADDLSDEHSYDAAVGAMLPLDRETVAELYAMRSLPAHHQHDLHLVRTERFTVTRTDTLTIPESVNGGYVLCLTPKR